MPTGWGCHVAGAAVAILLGVTVALAFSPVAGVLLAAVVYMALVL